MSGISEGTPSDIGPAARALLARAGGVDARAHAMLTATVGDALLPAEARLDDRARLALIGLVEALVAGIESDLRGHIARLLSEWGEPAVVLQAESTASTAARLADAGLLHDPGLIGECLARVRCELIAAALPAEAPTDPDTPSLLVRLGASTDTTVALAAAAVLAGENHRRALAGGSTAGGGDLPPALHRQLVWWVAAVLHGQAVPVAGDALAAVDRAIAEAAAEAIAAGDGRDRLEVTAMRLAAAIDARRDELPVLLDEALRDRRVTLLIAFVAHSLGFAYETARDLFLDPVGENLLLALRALDLPKPTIARIGYRLCEADGRRDAETFVDALDIVMGIDPATADAAIAAFRLPPDYRAAMRRLERRGING